MSILRKVLCNYEIIFNGIPYKGYGLYLEDTANPKVSKNKDYCCQIACVVLKKSPEELGRMINCNYWDISRGRLEEAGIKFRTIEITFYPPVR